MKKPALKSRILVCGGRDFDDRQFVFQQLDIYRKWFTPVFLGIQGEARGVDTHAKEWFKSQGMPCVGMEANWDFFGKSAGFIRNAWMPQFLYPDLVLAFPGGAGTANMLNIAKQQRIDHYRIIKVG